MPGMSGLDLIQLLTARGSTVPVIMVTGAPEPGLEARAIAGGAICLLMKPFEADALIGYLEVALKNLIVSASHTRRGSKAPLLDTKIFDSIDSNY